MIFDLAADVAGNVVVDSANEANHPTTPDAFQPTYVGVFPRGDVVRTKFDAFGQTCEHSNDFGGTKTDALPQLGLDESQEPSTRRTRVAATWSWAASTSTSCPGES